MNLKNLLAGSDIETIKSATDSLIHISYKFAEKLASKANQNQQTGQEEKRKENINTEDNVSSEQNQT